MESSQSQEPNTGIPITQAGGNTSSMGENDVANSLGTSTTIVANRVDALPGAEDDQPHPPIQNANAGQVANVPALEQGSTPLAKSFMGLNLLR
ncbi:hypothetical protein RSOLAG22IIIB_09209 [Rhizoctonia solani]|uniref:Uncharacterized protein n=1 Tax=Rhizoctonia solani TaxID=456999 RepID=A0A0K6FXE9_9AGAM|nr:hypothetical protein RSOLAG22IIIB_09209 [Rhizoctonia solani]